MPRSPTGRATGCSAAVSPTRLPGSPRASTRWRRRRGRSVALAAPRRQLSGHHHRGMQGSTLRPAIRPSYRFGMRLPAGTQAARLWARADLRRRWRSLVVLGLLAGLSASLAIGALSGARRADTAFDRLRERTDGADAVVFPSQVALYTGDWSELRTLPYVTAIASWNLVFGTLGDDPPGTSLVFMPDKGGWLQSADRPIVREGRMWDPSAPGEVLVDEVVAHEYGITVGTRVPFTAFRQGQNATGTPEGAHLELTVVGIVREPSQYLFPGAGLFLSPGTADRYGDAVERIGNSHVRLADPERDIARFRRDVTRLFVKGTPVLDLHSVQRRVGTAISVERVAQMLLGIAVGVAGIVFVGQALARSVATIDDDALVLRGLGFTRRDRTVTGVLPHLLSAAVAVPVALAGAAAFSPRFPIGFARTVDPSVGLHIDWTVVIPGLVVLALLVVGGAVDRGVATERPARHRVRARAPNGSPATIRRSDARCRSASARRWRSSRDEAAAACPCAPRCWGPSPACSGSSDVHRRARSRRRARQPGAGRGHVGRHRPGGHRTDHGQLRPALAGVRPSARGSRDVERRSDPRPGGPGRRRRGRAGLRRQAGRGARSAWS